MSIKMLLSDDQRDYLISVLTEEVREINRTMLVGEHTDYGKQCALDKGKAERLLQVLSNV